MIDLDRLQAQLLVSKLQSTNQPLYQVIVQLIKALKETQAQAFGGGSGGGGGTTITNITQQIQFINSLLEDGGYEEPMIVPGTGGSGSSTFVEWSVLTNGDLVTPELIFAGGDVIMVHVP